MVLKASPRRRQGVQAGKNPRRRGRLARIEGSRGVVQRKTMGKPTSVAMRPLPPSSPPNPSPPGSSAGAPRSIWGEELREDSGSANRREERGNQLPAGGREGAEGGLRTAKRAAELGSRRAARCGREAERAAELGSRRAARCGEKQRRRKKHHDGT
jgi:hypothetical protein